MSLACPACGSAIAAGDMNPEQTEAMCAMCGKIFSLSPHADSSETTREARPPVALPKGFSIRHEGTNLVIKKRPVINNGSFFVLACALFMDGFNILCAIYPDNVTYGSGFDHFDDVAPAYAYGIILSSISLGVFLTYIVLILFVNHTEFHISDQFIKVSYGPLPWWSKNKTIFSRDIDQLFSSEAIDETRGCLLCQVQVCLKNGERLALISGLEHRQDALFIEQQIEQRLKLQDRPVAGEITRG